MIHVTSKRNDPRTSGQKSATTNYFAFLLAASKYSQVRTTAASGAMQSTTTAFEYRPASSENEVKDMNNQQQQATETNHSRPKL